MTEDALFHEGGQQPLPLAQQVNELFEATAEFNQQNNGLLDPIIRSMNREDAINALIEQGVDEQSAINNVALVEDAEDPKAFDRSLFGIIHGQTLEATGLTTDDNPDYLTILISDAARFTEALDASQLDDQQQAELADNVGGYISGRLFALQDYLAMTEESQVTDIFSGQVPHWWELDDDVSLSAVTIQSNQQLLGGAGMIANRLEELGGNTVVAQNLRNVATFAQEGDLVSWAVARQLGIAPTTVDESYEISDVWRTWETTEAWLPAFKVIESAKRGGAFEKYLINSMGSLIDQDIADKQAAIDGGVEDYIRREREWEANRSAADHEADLNAGLITRASEESLRHDYDSLQRSAQQIIPELQKVRQQLSTYAA